MILYILLLIFAFSYVPIGRWVSKAFDEEDNSRYVFAWPAVLVWLLITISEDIPSLTKELIVDLTTPYIEED